MIRDFVCLNCRRKFRADDMVETICPYCKSDNISLLESDTMKYIIAAVCFVVFAAIGFLLPIGGGAEEPPIVGINDKYADEVQVVKEQYEEQMPKVDSTAIPHIVKITTPVLKNGKYDFDVIAEMKRGSMIYEVLTEPAGTSVARNNSGRFVGIPYSETGIYRIEVRNATDGSKNDYRLQAGFIKPEAPKPSIARVSNADVESYLNSQNKSELAKVCTSSASVVIVNASEIKGTAANYSGIMRNIRMGIWQRVVVEGLSYNGQNYVTSIKIRVIPKQE